MPPGQPHHVEEVFWSCLPPPLSADTSSEEEQRITERPKTPETPPHVKRGVPQTPRRAVISSLFICYKDPAYNDKMNRDLDTRYVEVSFRMFLDKLMRGARDLTPQELKKVASLSGLDKATPEDAMYPIIVRVVCYTFHFSSHVHYALPNSARR